MFQVLLQLSFKLWTVLGLPTKFIPFLWELIWFSWKANLYTVGLTSTVTCWTMVGSGGKLDQSCLGSWNFPSNKGQKLCCVVFWFLKRKSLNISSGFSGVFQVSNFLESSWLSFFFFFLIHDIPSNKSSPLPIKLSGIIQVLILIKPGKNGWLIFLRSSCSFLFVSYYCLLFFLPIHFAS